MSLWGFGKCSLALGERERDRRKKRERERKCEKEGRVERGPAVNCIAHWLLIESYGIHVGSDTLARGVRDHFALWSESVN